MKENGTSADTMKESQTKLPNLPLRSSIKSRPTLTTMMSPAPMSRQTTYVGVASSPIDLSIDDIELVEVAATVGPSVPLRKRSNVIVIDSDSEEPDPKRVRTTAHSTPMTSKPIAQTVHSTTDLLSWSQISSMYPDLQAEEIMKEYPQLVRGQFLVDLKRQCSYKEIEEVTGVASGTLKKRARGFRVRTGKGRPKKRMISEPTRDRNTSATLPDFEAI
ncbi:MAG: hypothetical protein M1834_006000 [Cirrosporium novae-zelandiae]|nr:MAG: hypothetical protein M1834_006000 [Cirrosporium novae-zelandiae]